MNHDPSFDFRSLLSTGTSGNPLHHACKCVVGVAWSGRGVGLVALTPKAAKGTRLKAYNNIALGPVEADWDEIAQTISRYLPLVFADKMPRVFLGGPLDKAGHQYRVDTAFEKAFPGSVEHIDRGEIERWVSDNPLEIAFPCVSPRNEWVLKPLYAAAETALFAGQARLDPPSPGDVGGRR